METNIAFCGLNCETCPIHLATLEPNSSHRQAMKESIAKICNRQYGMNLKPEDITDCDGCRANSGRLFSGCQSISTPFDCFPSTASRTSTNAQFIAQETRA